MAAMAQKRRLRGREPPSTIAPGGTDNELGFCAGVSSLLACRRGPGAATALRDSRVRTASPSLPDSAAAWATGLRAVTSAGLSSPVCVTVREGTGAGDAFGRDGVLRRRVCGRGVALGVERRPRAWLSLAAAASSALIGSGMDTGGTELFERVLSLDSSNDEGPGGAELCEAAAEALAAEALAAEVTGGSEPEWAPTV
jgi:hypothetical protein